jgi:hypothetical protein
LGKGAPRDQVMASGYQRVPKTPWHFVADKANSLRCGAPLEINITAKKRKPESYEINRPGVRNVSRASDSEYVLSINANVRGGDGEVYSTYAKGEKFRDDPAKPKFTIVDANDTKVGEGNLEFG